MTEQRTLANLPRSRYDHDREAIEHAVKLGCQEPWSVDHAVILVMQSLNCKDNIGRLDIFRHIQLRERPFPLVP
jgi:hypothetical protein